MCVFVPKAYTTCGELVLKALEEVAALQSTPREQMLPAPTTGCCCFFNAVLTKLTSVLSNFCECLQEKVYIK